MPVWLRPKAPVAADAILVGDPGRSLLLAQELLEQPRMSNHARGLWGYSGRTLAGRELTIQATGMGGPSAAAVLTDLAELGVRRAVRVGTCVGLGAAQIPDDGPSGATTAPGDLLLVDGAIACGGSVASFGLVAGDTIEPDPELHRRLGRELEDEASAATIASYDSMPTGTGTFPGEAVAADMQTVAVLARARELEIAAAAVLIVSETSDDLILDDPNLEAAAKRAGAAAATILST
jgi:uridine phosphorylase